MMIEIKEDDRSQHPGLSAKEVGEFFHDRLCNRYSDQIAETFTYGVRIRADRFRQIQPDGFPSDWLHKHLGLEHRVGFVDLSILGPDDQTYSIAYFFKDENDAFLFKIAWA